MDLQIQHMIKEVNRAVIQFRGIYSAWSKNHNISYNEMLVLYTIRDEGFCTQKQICDSYLLPRQTMNHVFLKMRNEGIIEIDSTRSSGKEKAFVLTDKGKIYSAPFLNSMNRVESHAADIMGEEKIKQMTALVKEFDRALQTALTEDTEGEQNEEQPFRK